MSPIGFGLSLASEELFDVSHAQRGVDRDVGLILACFIATQRAREGECCSMAGVDQRKADARQ